MADKIKLKWRVMERPTGRYGSFQKRGWPIADYTDGRIAVQLRCEHEYTPQRARAVDGLVLTVIVADWSSPSNTRTGEGFTWRTLKQRAVSLTEAKLLAARFLNAHPEPCGRRPATNPK
jgi:hypothetical protein